MGSALIPKIGSNQTSRGLGAGSAPTGNFEEVVIKITNAVYQEELYYPTTGVYAPEEIDGWYWDRTHSQGYADTPRHEIKDYIGGYKYNLQEGIPESYYQGAVLDGCELIDIKGSEKWKPVISTGMYCIDGIDKQLYSNASICKIVGSRALDLTGYGKDDITVAIYRRDGDYVKQKYREYKEDSIHYKYSIDEFTNILIIPSNESLMVGNKQAVLADTEKAFESVGYKTNPTQSFYTEYFPIKDIEVRYKKDNAYDLVDEDNYTVDADLGVIKITSDFSSEIFVAYEAVPRVDIELDPSVGFSSELDLKSHNWKQSNGIIEITSEDKHVAKIELKAERDPNSRLTLEYGTQSLRLKAQALDSKNNPVDEVLVTIKSNAEQHQEVRFEGNLLVTSGETNSDGSIFTRINAPLNNESSSFFVEGKYNNTRGLELPNKDLVDDSTSTAVLNNSLIFEVLKVDPFQGSGGLTLDVEWKEAEQAFEITGGGNNFESEDYKMFRNALKNAQVRSERGMGCFTVFYNSGFVEYEIPNFFGIQKKVPIKNITDKYIYVHSEEDSTSATKIKLFKKNENYEGHGLERLLYQKKPNSSPDTYEPIKPDGYNNGRLYLNNTVGNVDNVDRGGEEIVSGYRVFLPRKEELVAECIDPASGLVIKSAPLKISLQLNNIYKSVLRLEGENQEEVRLGVASHLSYDPVGNNIYFKADD